MLQPGGPIRYRLAAIFAAHWEQFVATYEGWIRPVVFETVRKILACQTPILGCHLYRCRCGETLVVPHSCKSRFCPRCGKLATDRWANGVLNELLDVPYHHLVFSVPWQLRPVIAFNRKVGLNLVVRAACGCLKQWAQEQKGMRMGIVAVIHTFGGDIKWHPHVHLLVTEGGLSLDGSRWIRPYNEGWLIAEASLKKMWRYHCITAFRKAHRAGAFRFPNKSRFLKKFPCFNKMLSNLYQKIWYVHIGAALGDPGATVRYIGRYTKRAVLAEYRITHYDGKFVRFRFKDYAKGGKISYKHLPVLAFLGRLIRHIPDKHFKMIRYAGIFAPRWKARYLEQARAALQQPAPVTVPATSSLPWRERRLAAGAPDPLLCRICQLPMRLVGKIFGSHQKIAEYFEAAGLPTRPDALGWQPEPG
jgi:Putative transposase/Transposase zinc-binding domain